MDTGGFLSLRIKRPKREADHFPSSNPMLRMHGAILPLPDTFSARGAYLSTKTTLLLPFFLTEWAF
jgi:hypothetical protein